MAENPSVRLPPILARLQEPTPSFGSLAPPGRIKRRDHKLLVPLITRAKLDRISNGKGHRSCQRDRSADASDSKPSIHRDLSLPIIGATNFDHVMAAAKRKVAHKKMAMRWSPEAVLDRVEATKREQLQHLRERELEVEVRFTKYASRNAVKLPPLHQPSPEHGSSVGDASMESEPSSPLPALATRRASLSKQGSVASLRSKATSTKRTSGFSTVVKSASATAAPPITSGPNVALSVLQKRFARLWLEMDDPYGYSAKEAMPLFNVYTRLIYEGDTELHKDELSTAAAVLGHSPHDKSIISNLADELSTSSTLSFDEFLRFNRRLTKFEKESWRKIFEKYDKDGSEQISVIELKAALQDLGWTPWRQVLQEAMAVVDEDGNGQMNFQEFKKFMVNWRKMEGFSKQELDELKDLYERFDRNSDGELDPDELARMKRFLGHAGSSETAVDSSQARKVPVGWQSFLAEIRRCREVEINGFRKKFAEYDRDGSGDLSLSELPMFLESMGVLPLKWRLRECMKEVDADGSGAINFDELVHLMWLYRRTEGFTVEEVAEIEEVFKMFDEDGSGEISTLELGNILRYEGYVPDLLELQRLSSQYDVDGTEELGLREFLKLMRAFREGQVKQFWKIFKDYDEDGSGTMSTSEVGSVLRALGLEVSLPIVAEAVASVDVDSSGELDWDEFVDLMERYRRLGLREKRRRCGYSDEQLKHYEQAFLAYDSDKTGDIGPGELMQLMEDLNLQPLTELERMRILSILERCRVLAEEPGEKITFWVYLRLLRTLEDDQDRSSLVVERQAAERAKFSKEEVGEFREIFVNWYDMLSSLGEGCGAATGVRALTAEGIARILRSLGMKLASKTDMEKLDFLTRECDQDGNGKVDFPDFLVLMRRLMDENFGNINAVIGQHALK